MKYICIMTFLKDGNFSLIPLFIPMDLTNSSERIKRKKDVQKISEEEALRDFSEAEERQEERIGSTENWLGQAIKYEISQSRQWEHRF